MTSFLLQTLKETVTEYINLKAGAAPEFQKLNDELRLLEAFLKDSAKRSEKKEVSREMERQIRELVYDVEDTIETCLARKAAARSSNFISRNVKKLSINMAQQVKSLRLERVKPIVDEITKEFGKFEIGDKPSSGNPLTQVNKVIKHLPP